MAKKPDTPCSGGCGKLLWTGPRSRPADQRLCRDCQKVTGIPQRPLLTAPAPLEAPSERFGPRAARLWAEMATDRAKMTPPEVVLLEEACRLADRLDRLDDFLAGRSDVWLRFHARNEDGSIVRVVVDRALTEVRQQQDTFRGMVADLLKKTGAAKEAPEEPKGSILDELARRRADRQQEAAGS